jgi:hypothetical protein
MDADRHGARHPLMAVGANSKHSQKAFSDNERRMQELV